MPNQENLPPQPRLHNRATSTSYNQYHTRPHSHAPTYSTRRIENMPKCHLGWHQPPSKMRLSLWESHRSASSNPMGEVLATAKLWPRCNTIGATSRHHSCEQCVRNPAKSDRVQLHNFKTLELVPHATACTRGQSTHPTDKDAASNRLLSYPTRLLLLYAPRASSTTRYKDHYCKERNLRNSYQVTVSRVVVQN